MLGLLQRHPLVVALSGVVALLLVAVGLEAGFGSSLHGTMARAPARRAVPFEAKLLPSLAASQPERLYPETTARPLFIPTRRPAPEAPAPGTFKSGQFILQGVTIVGDNRIAMLREKASGKVHRVEKGKEINGVKVAEISPESVTLTQGAEQEVLPLLVLKPEHVPAVAASIGPFSSSTPGAGRVGALGGQPTGLVPKAAPAGPAAFNPNSRAIRRGVVNPPVPALPQATGVPELPEALLARRRARRAQQTP